MSENKKNTNEIKISYFERMKNFIKTQSDTSIYCISFSISLYLAYNYLKKKHVMKEYHGHFNSPQNMLNRKLTTHYLKDAGARLILAFTILSLSQMGCKFYLGGYEINKNIIINISQYDLEDEEYFNPGINEKDITDALKHRENVNKYLKK